MTVSAPPSRESATREFLREEKSLASLPSPTLTDPDMVLPGDIDSSASPSPARTYARPPSPSYLRNKTDHNGSVSSATPNKERRGLMSRKMLLLRSRTGSGAGAIALPTTPSRAPPSTSSATPEECAYASSPTIHDASLFAPEQTDHKRLSASTSSFNSDELAAIPSFLAKYDSLNGTGADDDTDLDSPAQKKYGYSVSIEGGVDTHRRQQEEDERNSAMLSKRAEQILANAKKRLNLMEGNLRGARDLVAPLTTANLKRATSLVSSQHHPHARGPVSRRQLSDQQPMQTLHAQTSLPTLTRVYSGRARVFNVTKGPDRSQNVPLARNSSLSRNGREPVKVEPSQDPVLRNSRSYDSFGGDEAQHAGGCNNPLHVQGLPDPNLDPGLPEDDGPHRTPSAHADNADTLNIHNALGNPRSSTKSTEDLRTQMSSLRGRISTLQERAREDSLKRQSLQTLRTSSLLNNAAASAPEMYYMQSPGHGSPVHETDAEIDSTSSSISPTTAKSPQREWERDSALPGSRNAFAEEAANHLPEQQHPSPYPEWEATSETQRPRLREGTTPALESRHRRMPSGTAIVAPAANRYSHHQYVPSTKLVNAENADEARDCLFPARDDDMAVSPLPSDESETPDFDFVVSEDEGSSPEEMKHEHTPLVAHEDRDDAFDYENFFLHSAMGRYNTSRRSSSTSSEKTITSIDTAQALGAAESKESRFNSASAIYPPPTPETPERLREIERKLHQRAFSTDSVSTFATFTTAHEGDTPTSERSLDWPLPRTDTAGQDTRAGSRAGPALKNPPRQQWHSSSERADSGVGLPRQSHSSHDAKRLNTPTPSNAPMSPPMSPHATMLQDPTSIAVQALLDPDANPLGLKDKARLFGLVESLRRVCHTLQETEPGQLESRALRRRLDEATRALNGSLEQRPASRG